MDSKELKKIFDECYNEVLKTSFSSPESIQKELLTHISDSGDNELSGILSFAIIKSFEMNRNYINSVLTKVLSD